jgi:hypothetical protein
VCGANAHREPYARGDTLVVVRRVITLVIVVAAARVAAAEPEWARGVSADNQARANALFAEANQLFAEQAHAPALDKYQAAVALWDHPLIRFNMAVTLIRLDRILDAADNLDRALRFAAAPFTTKELYQQALDYQTLVRGRVGTIAASCDQPDAHVVLDGAPWFDCPGAQQKRVMAGEHVLVADKPGYMTRSRRLVVAGGAVSTEKLALVPIESVVRLQYRYPRWVPWTIAGAGAALALGGVAEYFAGKSQMDHFQSDFALACQLGCKPDLSDQPGLAVERDSAKSKGQIGIGMIIGGGAIAVGGVVAAILDRPKRILPSLEVAPTPGGASARVGWRW